MTDESTQQDGVVSSSRRRVLQTAGLASIGLAGCIGGSGSNNGEASGGSSSNGSSGGNSSNGSSGGNSSNGSSGGNSSNGSSGGNSSNGAETIHIGIALPRSGSNSSLSSLLEGGYLGFRDWVNNELGGIKSDDGQHKIKLDLRDDQSNESRASKLATRFATNDQYGAFVEAYGSSLVQAAAAVADKRKKVLMSSVSANTPLHKKYKYLLQTSTTITRTGDAKLLDGKVDKVAVMGPDMSWVNQSLTTFEDAAKDAGLEIVVNDRFASDTRDFSAQITKAQNSGAEALIESGYAEHTQAIVNGITSSNWRPKYGSFQTFPVSLAKELGKKTSNKLGYPSIWNASLDIGTNPQLKKHSKKYIPSGSAPTYQTALAWATMEDYKAAIAALGNDFNDSDKLRNWLLSAKIDTVVGTEKWNSKGAQVGVGWNLAQWQVKDGSFNRPYVYPKEFKQADFKFPKTTW